MLFEEKKNSHKNLRFLKQKNKTEKKDSVVTMLLEKKKRKKIENMFQRTKNHVYIHWKQQKRKTKTKQKQNRSRHFCVGNKKK